MANFKFVRSSNQLALVRFPLALTLTATANLVFVAVSWGQTTPTDVLPSGTYKIFCNGCQSVDPTKFDTQNPTAEQETESLPDGPDSSAQADTAASIALSHTAPAGSGTIAEIQVRFVDKAGQPVQGQTRPFIITREFDLRPGDVYDQSLAQQGLDRVLTLDIVKQASLALEPAIAPGQVVLVVNVVERSSFSFGFGVSGYSPTALPGPFQPRSVLTGPDEDSGFAVPGNIGFQNLGGNDQSLTLQAIGGGGLLDTELSFIDPWIATDPDRTGYALNFFNQRAFQGVFDGGGRTVSLSNGRTPWVHRLGGGIEVFRPLTPEFRVALGASYQRVSVREDVFSDRLYTRDELGDRLTVSSSGNDDLLMVRFAGDLNQLDNLSDPTRGDRVRFGVDQAIPVGEANLHFTRLTANYVQYIPVPLFGFTEGPRTLVLNVQAGTMLGGAIPPYEAFDLNSSLASELGTGSSFVLAAAQYRFPIANFSLFSQPIHLGGVFLGGYVSDFGTASEVVGKPAIVREKPGDSYIFGVGLRAGTSLGLIQVQFNFTTEGNQVSFFLGEQF